MTANDHPTPEERYDYEMAELDVNRFPAGCIQALRDMISSHDAKLARLTVTVNRQDDLLTDLNRRLVDNEPPASPEWPDTVSVPRSLIEALDNYFANPHLIEQQQAVLNEYNAWKAGRK